MTSPLIGFRPKEKVGQIIDILKTENMCGFPITETPEDVSNNWAALVKSQPYASAHKHVQDWLIFEYSETK